VEALREGQSVAQVAAERGVALEDVVEALLEEPREHLAQAVEEGQMTQEEADERLIEIESHITEHLQQPWLPREWGRGRGHGERFGQSQNRGVSNPIEVPAPSY
jgi:hypothetical protein